ncbi:unnamed protein product [Effrenium voratum]|uniref:Uncharacterized protein n=1 Tax=Effrenium voratum TaxID=2562239 RepID=A0AA36HY13_9DINO|nr:unnamed protein product [Effrenium voratum]
MGEKHIMICAAGFCGWIASNMHQSRVVAGYYCGRAKSASAPMPPGRLQWCHLREAISFDLAWVADQFTGKPAHWSLKCTACFCKLCVPHLCPSLKLSISEHRLLFEEANEKRGVAC